MIVNYKDKDIKLPDFLIVGAAKSGTTSLHYYLKQHPQIFMPKIKELYFFNFMDSPPNCNNDEWWSKNAVTKIEDYIVHFEDVNDRQMIGEACPVYLYMYENTIKNIKKVYGQNYKRLKIIIILRDPAERAWSHFSMHRRDGIGSFTEIKEAIKPAVIGKMLMEGRGIIYDYIGYGMYYGQVKAFMEEFSCLKVFFYDDLCKDARKLLKEMFGFIGVDEDFILDMETKYNISGDMRFQCLHTLISGKYPFKDLLKSFLPYETRQRIKFFIQGKTTRRCRMPDDIRKELIERHYKDDIVKLQGLIEKDLSMWIK